MEPSRQRRLFRLALLVAIGIALLLWYTWGQSPTHLVVENRSGQTITRLQITVGGEPSTFHDVKAGAAVSVLLGRSGALIVEGEFADGSMIRWQGPAGEGPRLLILPKGEIAVRQSGQK